MPTTKSGSRHAHRQRRFQHRQIGRHGCGGLVSIAGILPQQPLHDLIEHPGNLAAQTAELGDAGRHVLHEHGADRRPAEGRMAGEHLEQQHACRIEIGRFADVVAERAGLFGRQIQSIVHGLAAGLGAQHAATGEAEIRQHDGRGRRFVADDNVRRPEIEAEYSAGMQFPNRGKQPAADPQDLPERQSRAPDLRQRYAVDIRPHPIQHIVAPPEIEQRRQSWGNEGYRRRPPPRSRRSRRVSGISPRAVRTTTVSPVARSAAR